MLLVKARICCVESQTAYLEVKLRDVQLRLLSDRTDLVDEVVDVHNGGGLARGFAASAPTSIVLSALARLGRAGSPCSWGPGAGRTTDSGTGTGAALLRAFAGRVFAERFSLDGGGLGL